MKCPRGLPQAENQSVNVNRFLANIPISYLWCFLVFFGGECGGGGGVDVGGVKKKILARVRSN